MFNIFIQLVRNLVTVDHKILLLYVNCITVAYEVWFNFPFIVLTIQIIDF